MLPFLLNEGDYFASNYFGEDLARDIETKSGYAAEQLKEWAQGTKGLRASYEAYKRDLLDMGRTAAVREAYTRRWHDTLLGAMGYAPEATAEVLLDLGDSTGRVLPLRGVYRGGDGKPQLVLVELPPPERSVGQDVMSSPTLFEAGVHVPSALGVPATEQRVYDGLLSDALKDLFRVPEELQTRPRYALVLAGRMLYLLEEEHWMRESYLGVDLDEVFQVGSTKKNLRLLYCLLGKTSLVPIGGQPLLDTLNEESHRKAVAVTKDLKRGVVLAVELLANEALYAGVSAAEGAAADLPRQLTEEVLRLVYRLLFLFYAEARDELRLLPLDSDVYTDGYALGMLRELELTRLDSEQAKQGFYFHESLHQLFTLLWRGHRPNLLDQGDKAEDLSAGFGVRRIDSPLFDPDQMPLLRGVRFRNSVWQAVIQELSLSKPKGKHGTRGRISYANLDIKELGSVYEGLLSFRGIIADEPLIEVHKKGNPEDGTYLVAASRAGDFKDGYTARGYSAKDAEILQDEDGRPVTHGVGQFVYRLNGRDRQRSASYYTPESLTRTTVWFALEEVRERLAIGARGIGAPGIGSQRARRDAESAEQGAGAEQDGSHVGGVTDILPSTHQTILPSLTPMKAADLLDLRILEPAMGAAAFQNEAINQLAKLYLDYRQQEMVAAGGARVGNQQYGHELRRVKAYLATHNVYGVDLNATAIELGRLSLWLNCIHDGMEVPYFGHRLGHGNAVVGCWLRVFPKGAIYAADAKTSKTLKWWLREPTDVRLPFHTTGAHEKLTGYRKPERSPGSVYHFLLPDEGMAAAADNALVKTHFKAKAEHARKWRKAFTSALSKAEYDTVVRLSAKLDTLLVDHLRLTDRLNALVSTNAGCYGVAGQTGQLGFTSREKAEFFEQRERLKSAYARIRLVMDYEGLGQVLSSSRSGFHGRSRVPVQIRRISSRQIIRLRLRRLMCRKGMSGWPRGGRLSAKPRTGGSIAGQAGPLVTWGMGSKYTGGRGMWRQPGGS